MRHNRGRKSRKELALLRKEKPVNRVFCFSAGRQKLQFDTRDRAMRFLEYNAEKIGEETGKYPCRAYYCKCCCCWHVTSQEGDENMYVVERDDASQSEGVSPEEIAARIEELRKIVGNGEKQ